MEKFTDAKLEKFSKNVSAAIQALNAKINELSNAEIDPNSPQMQELLKQLREVSAENSASAGAVSRKISDLELAVELAKKKASDAKTAVEVAAVAAEDANDLASVAKRMAEKAQDDTAELGKSIEQTIASLEKENGILSGDVAEIKANQKEIQTTVSSFEADMDQLTGKGGTIDSLKGSISKQEQTSKKIEGRVSEVEAGVVTNAASIKTMADNIALRVSKRNIDGTFTTTEIKLTDDYKIYLTGDVIADTLLADSAAVQSLFADSAVIESLFAKDITATGNFQISNRFALFTVTNEMLQIQLRAQGVSRPQPMITLSPTGISMSAGGNYGKLTSSISLSGGVKIDRMTLTGAVNGYAMSATICENGTSNGWHYKKYSDGTCDLSIRLYLGTFDITTAAGSWYQNSSSITWDYPFEVGDAVVTATYESTNYKGGLAWVSVPGTTSKTPGFRIMRMSSVTESDGYLNIHVAGTCAVSGSETA